MSAVLSTLATGEKVKATIVSEATMRKESIEYMPDVTILSQYGLSESALIRMMNGTTIKGLP